MNDDVNENGDDCKWPLSSTETCWTVGTMLVILVFLLSINLNEIYIWFTDRLVLYQAADIVLKLLGGVALAFGGWVAWKRAKASERQVGEFAKQVRVSEDGQLTERLSRTVELIGNKNMAVRIAAIHTLEQIAKDYCKKGDVEDHWTVIEMLTAFVRVNSPWEEGKQSSCPEPAKDLAKANDNDIKWEYYREVEEWVKTLPPLPHDIQAALTAIARRTKTDFDKEDRETSRYDSRHVDLSFTNLRKAQLPKALLNHANLRGAHLEGANLHKAHLYEADLYGAHFEGAFLVHADMRYGNLGALEGEQLAGANFNGANLSSACLRHASTDGTAFDGAFLDMTCISESNRTLNPRGPTVRNTVGDPDFFQLSDKCPHDRDREIAAKS